MTAKRQPQRPWSKRDVSVMRQHAREFRSARECARVLKRTRGAVAFKAMKLGVRFRAVEQPKGVQKRAAARRRRQNRPRHIGQRTA